MDKTVRRTQWQQLAALALVCATVASCSKAQPQPRSAGQTFKAPEEAVRALDAAVQRSDVPAVAAIFGPDGQELVDTSDPVDARQNREVFAAAMAEGWRLVDEGKHKTLVVGNEGWPFPVPLVRDGDGWRFDAAAGKEEVLARRIGRNELAVIQVCRTYVAAQRLYAQRGHDGQPAGVYAASFASDPGRENGLYWVAAHGQPRSPLGDLMSEAAESRATASKPTPSPFHGYYFRILTAQGDAAQGGAKDYVAGGRMSGGFALVAWPAKYDLTGVMTFLINHDGVVYEKDLGEGTAEAVERVVRYDPDSSWTAVE